MGTDNICIIHYIIVVITHLLLLDLVIMYEKQDNNLGIIICGDT